MPNFFRKQVRALGNTNMADALKFSAFCTMTGKWRLLNIRGILHLGWF